MIYICLFGKTVDWRSFIILIKSTGDFIKMRSDVRLRMSFQRYFDEKKNFPQSCHVYQSMETWICRSPVWSTSYLLTFLKASIKKRKNSRTDDPIHRHDIWINDFDHFYHWINKVSSVMSFVGVAPRLSERVILVSLKNDGRRTYIFFADWRTSRVFDPVPCIRSCL